MRVIDRYLLRLFFRNFLGSLCAFSSLYFLVEFFAKVDDFLEHGASFLLFFPYFSGILPAMTSVTIPLAVLLGTFLTLAKLNRAHELTALRAGGIGLMRVCRPMLVVSLACSLAMLLASEFVSPQAARLANRILEEDVKGKHESSLKRDNLWFRRGDQFIHIVLADLDRDVLYGLSAITVDNHFRILRRVDAPKALFRNGRWVAQDAVAHVFTSDYALPPSFALDEGLSMGLELAPSDFQLTDNMSEGLRTSELYRLTVVLGKSGVDSPRLKTDLHSRFAAPFNSLAVCFLAIPFALKGPRSAGLGRNLTLTVFIGLSLYFGQALFEALGYGGLLPPAAAAWSGNLLFGGLGGWLLLSRRE